MPIKNYTTQIPLRETLGDIMAMLAAAGAEEITLIYPGPPGTARWAAGVRFIIATRFGRRLFTLPMDAEAIWRNLTRDADAGRVRRGFATREHAAAVGWRILRDWLDAQLALIEADMTTLDQIMLPYLTRESDGMTIYALMVERHLLPPVQEAADAG